MHHPPKLTQDHIFNHVSFLELEKIFLRSCINSDMQTLNLLFQTYKFKEKISANSGFGWACAKGNLDVVKFLIKDLRFDLDARIFSAQPFRQACFNGHLDVVMYLLKDASEKNKAYTTIQKQVGFFEACKGERYEVATWFIFNESVEQTTQLNYLLSPLPQEIRQRVQSIFDMKKEKEKLELVVPPCTLPTRCESHKI